MAGSAESHADLDAVADYLAVPRASWLPRPGETATWDHKQWDEWAQGHGFAAPLRTKHSFLYEHRVLPVRFGLASTPGDHRSHQNTAGDLRQAWRAALRTAGGIMAAEPALPAVDVVALLRAGDKGKGTGDRDERLDAAGLRLDESLRKWAKESGRKESTLEEEVFAALHGEEDSVGRRLPELQYWERAAAIAEAGLIAFRDDERQRKEAVRAAREQERAAKDQERAAERARKQDRDQGEHLRRDQERRRRAERSAFEQALGEQRRAARQALEAGDRALAELAMSRFDALGDERAAAVERADRFEGGLRRLVGALQPLLASGAAADLARAQALVDDVAAALAQSDRPPSA